MFFPTTALRAKLAVWSLFLLSFICLHETATAQDKSEKKPATPGPMLALGTMDLETHEFRLSLVRSSQTVAALKPKGGNGFDFTPSDLLVERSQAGFMHLGDITLRLRTGKPGEWKNYATSIARTPVAALPVSTGVLAAAGKLYKSRISPGLH